MIITNNEELLRVKCEDVLAHEIGPLKDQLERELENSGRLGRSGIGLAAPQIGIAKKMAIVRLGPPELELDLINASIMGGYDPFIHKDEGCLSFPGRSENVERYQEILVSNGLDNDRIILTGLLAVCTQHELDHVEGILLPDRAIKKVIEKIRPNNFCPCGSGKKYKKCCGK